MSKNYLPDTQTYFALALDPIHVGTGGYRLGRVDMSIVREPGTNVPKIPGSSISGACRAYAAMRTAGKYPRCAGQGQEGDKKGHCGQDACPVCTAFGFARGERGGRRGLAAFGDARILFFPVHSMAGPVWITSPQALHDGTGFQPRLADESRFRLIKGFENFQPGTQPRRLNLGWLMLEEAGEGDFVLDWQGGRNHLAAMHKRVVLVSNKLFGQIVNDNLEVRTSVSIDPETGAAKEHMLFTYEAIPRGTLFWFDVVYSDPQFFALTLEPKPAVEKGLRLFEHLGVGGMGTRGMGRLRVLGLNEREKER